MELKYRGVSYYTNPTHVQVRNKENTVMFRGCSYQLKGAILNLEDNSSKNKEMIYRAVKTGQTYKKHFLGQTYLEEKVLLHPVGA